MTTFCLSGMKSKPGFRLDSITIASEAKMNTDQIKGRAKIAKGKTEEMAGKLLNDKTMEKKGGALKKRGIVQSAYGDLKDDLSKS